MLDPESEILKGMLLDEGLCDEEQLVEIEEEHERTGRLFQDLLVDYEIISKDELMGLIAQNLGTDIVDLAGFDIEKEVIDMIDPSTIRMYGVIPLKYEDETLTVATANPLNYQIPEELHFILGKNVHIVIADQDQIDAAIEKYYPMETESMSEMLDEFDIDIQDASDFSGEDVANLEDMASSTPIVRFVDVILYQAIKAEASDVHFEPFEKEFKIRYRVDGALYEMSPPPKNLALPVISRVKIMSGLNIAERRRPQDGRIQLRIAGRPVDLRVSSLPTAHGESVVLRVLDRSVVNLDLDVLGIAGDVLRDIRDMIHRPNGIFIVTGPTGSGKTTTLYSGLKEINKIEDKLLTAEDPIEYDIEGIIQLPINDAIGMTFSRALRAFLRQDPDRIMIGEIRDLDTAQMAVQASLTGHFVFSTLHTNDAPGTVTRLIDMGVEPFLITSSLVGVLGQRLIRTICKNCKTAFDPTDDDLKQLGLERDEIGDRKFHYGKGCSVCNQSGYKGRKAICELLNISSEIRELIIEKAPTIVIKEKARELGMRTLREDGIRSILDGDATMEEVLKYT
jgi:type IV pilus assembly protein PilB